MGPLLLLNENHWQNHRGFLKPQIQSWTMCHCYQTRDIYLTFGLIIKQIINWSPPPFFFLCRSRLVNLISLNFCRLYQHLKHLNSFICSALSGELCVSQWVAVTGVRFSEPYLYPGWFHQLHCYRWEGTANGVNFSHVPAPLEAEIEWPSREKSSWKSRGS